MIDLRKKTVEDYVEKLYELQKGDSRVHTNEVASSFKIKPASVTEIFVKLKEEGYINYKKYGGVSLTEKGKELARETRRRHDALFEFLVMIGVERKIAERDACEMEHILHKKSMSAIIKFVDVINKCRFTPLFIKRLKKYVETGKLSECPSEVMKICKKYSTL